MEIVKEPVRGMSTGCALISSVSAVAAASMKHIAPSLCMQRHGKGPCNKCLQEPDQAHSIACMHQREYMLLLLQSRGQVNPRDAKAQHYDPLHQCNSLPTRGGLQWIHDLLYSVSFSVSAQHACWKSVCAFILSRPQCTIGVAYT